MLLVYPVTAIATYYVASFIQASLHALLGHGPAGRGLRRDHLRYHHSVYSRDRLVSEKYIEEPHSVTPYYVVPADKKKQVAMLKTATKEAFLEGGWLRTGDVAIRDEDGYLYLVDRKKDLIIVSGFNVYPVEVEDVLLRHEKVAEAGVIGIPDERTGEAVKAFVVLREGEEATPEEILEFARTSLARFKLPREIEVMPSLPRHVTGKVLRRALRGK